MTEDEMVGWHHLLNGHELEQTPQDGEGQGSLASCSTRGCRVGHNRVTEKQNAHIMCIQLYTASQFAWKLKVVLFKAVVLRGCR